MMPDDSPFFEPTADWTPLHQIERNRPHQPNPVKLELVEREVEVKPSLLALLGFWYCRRFHTNISAVIHGKYHCWKCLREYRSSFK